MKILDKARDTVSATAAAVSGAMRVAIISCVLSVLAVLISLCACMPIMRQARAQADG